MNDISCLSFSPSDEFVSRVRAFATTTWGFFSVYNKLGGIFENAVNEVKY